MTSPRTWPGHEGTCFCSCRRIMLGDLLEFPHNSLLRGRGADHAEDCADPTTQHPTPTSHTPFSTANDQKPSWPCGDSSFPRVGMAPNATVFALLILGVYIHIRHSAWRTEHKFPELSKYMAPMSASIWSATHLPTSSSPPKPMSRRAF